MRDDGPRDAFQAWKRERDAIEQEMKLFLAEDRRASVEDRQARQVQFAALIERRNIAMRNLLQSASNRLMPGAVRDQETTMMQLSPSPGTAEEARPAALPEQRTEPAGLGRAVAAEIGFISEDPFNLALGSQALPSARGPEPEVLNREIDGLLEAISHDSFVFRGEGAELAKAPLPPQQPDNVRGRAISARFLPLWRIGLGRLVSRRSDERCDLICPDLSKVL